MTPDPVTARSRSKRRVAVWISVVVAVGLVLVLALGLNHWFVDSSSQATVYFSGHVTTPSPCNGGSACVYASPPNQTLPGGENASLQWTDESGGYVSFWVQGPGPHASTINVCFWENVPHGACSFTPVGGVYLFYASNAMLDSDQTLNYTGSYVT
jgi:hypothetical protein